MIPTPQPPPPTDEDVFVARYFPLGHERPADALPWTSSEQVFEDSGWYRVPRASLPPDVDPRTAARIVRRDGTTALAPGVLVVRFAPELDADTVSAALAALGLRSVRALSFAANLHTVVPTTPGFVDGVALAASIRARDPRCLAAEPSWIQRFSGRR